MNIKNRIERLESLLLAPGDAEVIWNFENISTDDLIELRDLIDRDPRRAVAFQTKLIDEGKLSYEYQEPN